MGNGELPCESLGFPKENLLPLNMPKPKQQQSPNVEKANALFNAKSYVPCVRVSVPVCGTCTAQTTVILSHP